MAYYRNYYDLQSEYDEEQSMADSQTDLYGYNNKFRPQRQDNAIMDGPFRRTKKHRNTSDQKSYQGSSFMNQDLYYLPGNKKNNKSNFNNTYQKPRNSSFINSSNPVESTDGCPNYYQQDQQGRRQSSQLNKQQYYDYPITPEEDDRRNSYYLYHNPSFASSAEEVSNRLAAANQDDRMYMAPESQHSAATLDDEDDISFIEDTTTQRNTLINSETSSHTVTDAYYQKQTMSPSAGNVVSPLQLTSPFEPPPPPAPASLLSSQQQQEEPETSVKPQILVTNSNTSTEKKKWYRGIMSTALIIKKRAQKFKRDDTLERLNDSSQHQAFYGNHVSSPSIQVISAGNNDLVGDVLDSRQQQELIARLYQSPPPAPGSNANLLPEKTKITSLERIWVFRLHEEAMTSESNSNHIAWIGFDFENQLKIEQHVKELETRPEDGRLALYDSHIRHKTMPVIVTPNDNKGYYFADVHQNELITLEITFIENDHQKVTFVYRV